MENESSTKILWTKNYGLFSFIHGNRDLNVAKINKLIKDVENGLDLFKYCPILVNEDMHIIDGQHRFVVCQKLKRNVYYIIVPNFTLRDIARLNNNQNRWKMRDFLNCYADAGKNKADYQMLDKFIAKYGITVSMGISALYSGTVHANGTDYLNIFRDGEFEVRFLDEATEILNVALEYEPYNDYCRNREFIATLQKLLKNGKFSHKAMLEKLEVNKLTIEKRANVKEYLAHMEELFNFKNSKRKTIY